jgi:hypothetical protein
LHNCINIVRAAAKLRDGPGTKAPHPLCHLSTYSYRWLMINHNNRMAVLETHEESLLMSTCSLMSKMSFLLSYITTLMVWQFMNSVGISGLSLVCVLLSVKADVTAVAITWPNVFILIFISILVLSPSVSATLTFRYSVYHNLFGQLDDCHKWVHDRKCLTVKCRVPLVPAQITESDFFANEVRLLTYPGSPQWPIH